MTRCLPKPRHRNSASSTCAGSSLLEVMLAVALMAVTALGLIAAQLWIAREARAMSMREHATWIADSVAEATHAPSTADAALKQWSTRAGLLLPQGKVSVAERAGMPAALVTWTAVRDMPRSGDVIDKPEKQETCGAADVPAGSSCVALAFSK